jgi:STAS-like domain of unknown function (DUF4325)
MIHPCLLKNKKVLLDFEGVEVVAPPFLNIVIGQLYKDFTSEQLQNLLELKNFPTNSKVLLERVIENSKEYYANSKFRKALDEVIKEKAESI